MNDIVIELLTAEVIGMQGQKEIVESVDRFIGFFKNKMRTIDCSEFRESTPLFKKILYVGLLDALAGTIYSRKIPNRTKFTSFISQFGGWREQDRVSLPHLVRLLNKFPDPEFSLLRQYAYSLIDNWSPGEVIKINQDPPLSEVKKNWPFAPPKAFDGLTAEHIVHLNLLYRYRNALVHEFRKPGYGAEFEGDTEPFYSCMSDIDIDVGTWELIYPVGFFQMICETALEHLREYYILQRIDPYTLNSFGTYWIEELNG